MRFRNRSVNFRKVQLYHQCLTPVDLKVTGQNTGYTDVFFKAMI